MRQLLQMRHVLHRRRIATALVALGLAAGVLLPLQGRPAAAFQDDGAASFLNPFPEHDVYRLWVIGDGFADGLLDGLVEGFGTDPRLNIERKVVPVTGIMRNSFDAKLAAFEQAVTPGAINIAVVMLGEDDRMSFRNDKGRRVPIATPEWVQEYQRRISELMKVLKRKGAAVYWVGLPNLMRVDANEQAQVMNETIRERAFLNGFKYIDAAAGFQDESGGYSAYGPDLDGKIRVLRTPDGEHFTRSGNNKLAHFVEKEIRRDLNQAKQSRDVPLLGGDAEQALINPENTVKEPAPSSPSAKPEAGNAPLIRAQQPTHPADAAKPQSEEAAENSKISIKSVAPSGKAEVEQIEIIRPAIPASVVALMARRESSGQPGDLLIDQIGGGVTLMTSISPTGRPSKGRLSPTQAPYFRLLVKGERLQPKPGRADDIEWPPAQSDATGGSGATGAAPKG